MLICKSVPARRELSAAMPSCSEGCSRACLRVQRKAKFASLYMPIVIQYLLVMNKVSRLRKRYKKRDPARYTAERNRLLSAQHIKAAPQLRGVFEKMAGLYNKARERANKG